MINTQTFHTASNKRLEIKLPSVLERAITVIGVMKQFSWKIVLIESFYKFQPNVALAARSMNIDYFLIRKHLILLLPFILLYTFCFVIEKLTTNYKLITNYSISVGLDQVYSLQRTKSDQKKCLPNRRVIGDWFKNDKRLRINIYL